MLGVAFISLEEQYGARAIRPPNIDVYRSALCAIGTKPTTTCRGAILSQRKRGMPLPNREHQAPPRGSRENPRITCRNCIAEAFRIPWPYDIDAGRINFRIAFFQDASSQHKTGPNHYLFGGKWRIVLFSSSEQPVFMNALRCALEQPSTVDPEEGEALAEAQKRDFER